MITWDKGPPLSAKLGRFIFVVDQHDHEYQVRIFYGARFLHSSELFNSIDTCKTWVLGWIKKTVSELKI